MLVHNEFSLCVCAHCRFWQCLHGHLRFPISRSAATIFYILVVFLRQGFGNHSFVQWLVMPPLATSKPITRLCSSGMRSAPVGSIASGEDTMTCMYISPERAVPTKTKHGCLIVRLMHTWMGRCGYRCNFVTFAIISMTTASFNRFPCFARTRIFCSSSIKPMSARHFKFFE